MMIWTDEAISWMIQWTGIIVCPCLLKI